MPTARELLEQADALMRRNRSPVADDIPVLTEAISPQPALRVPLRPSPESPPPVPADEPSAAPVDVIPTLTDKVPASEPDQSGAVTAEGEPSDWLDLDEGEPSITGKAPNSVMSVPEVATAEALHEFADADAAEAPITEEIELAPAVEAEFEAELGGVEPPAAEPDVLTPMPAEDLTPTPAADGADALASAPPADEEPVARTPWPESELPPEVDALPALAAEAEMVFESPSSVGWNVEALLADEGSAAAEAAPVPVAVEEPPTAFAAPPATEADEPVLAEPPLTSALADEPPRQEGGPVSLAPSPAQAFVAAPQAAVGASPGHDLQRGDVTNVAPEDDYPVEPGALPHTGATEVADFAPWHPAVAAPAAAPATPDDAARWEAMAEEIRMQVLQRIDLFTDTGLREQLGARLQPIVDRASADLVRTINLHVGELLRAYVAEAIEREIERWKLSQR